MRKIENIYKTIVSKENLYKAAYKAARCKRYNPSVSDFLFEEEKKIDMLYKKLADMTYRHGKYKTFMITDPKKRRISAAPFRDRVVHHAVHDIIEPVIDKTFIYDSYACRKAKGTHKAIDRADKFLRANRFCFHGDIKKYFPSIDHGVLKGLLRRRVADKNLLWLLENIIDSANQLTEQKGKGLPIGNLTSQFFANLYLHELDYFVKHELGLRYYLRYMDDFLVFGDDKDGLIRIKSKIRDFLRVQLCLDLHPGKSQIYKTKAGVKFLGFRLYKHYRRLSSDNVRRFRKRLKKFEKLIGLGLISYEQAEDSVRCWTAHSRHANTYRLRRKIAEEFSGNLPIISIL